MKKTSVVARTIVAFLTMLFSFLPMNAVFAEKEDTTVGLQVRNRTGGIVEIKLVDENGNFGWFTYGPGQTTTHLPEGKYFYYATTPCGNQSGVFNINVTKQLVFACGETLEVALTVPVHKGPAPSAGPDLCYSVFDYMFNPDGNSPVDAFLWGPIGAHCQPNSAKLGDTIQFYNPNYNETGTYRYEPDDGAECFQGGNGYYYQCPWGT